MKNFCFTGLVLVACTIVPIQVKALDLTPEHSFRDLEGINVPIVRFNDDAKKIAFQPPAKWTVSGGGSSVTFYPPELLSAFMQFRVCARKPTADGVTEDLEKWCRSQLPVDAHSPVLEGQPTNPFTLGKLPSQEFTFSYIAQGRRFTTSVAIVDWNDHERFALVVTALAPQFAAVHGAAVTSMFSWCPQ